ncbi:hypothetical protein F5Y16DRAFT_77453 [Xylariaceae sp. FL0255]|nr:hypothetical protein F5Y16DRAFT_77453 [Xylariaceae sp. FL0255]
MRFSMHIYMRKYLSSFLVVDTLAYIHLDTREDHRRKDGGNSPAHRIVLQRTHYLSFLVFVVCVIPGEWQDLGMRYPQSQISDIGGTADHSWLGVDDARDTLSHQNQRPEDAPSCNKFRAKLAGGSARQGIGEIYKGNGMSLTRCFKLTHIRRSRG